MSRRPLETWVSAVPPKYCIFTDAPDALSIAVQGMEAKLWIVFSKNLFLNFLCVYSSDILETRKRNAAIMA